MLGSGIDCVKINQYVPIEFLKSSELNIVNSCLIKPKSDILSQDGG